MIYRIKVRNTFDYGFSLAIISCSVPCYAFVFCQVFRSPQSGFCYTFCVLGLFVNRKKNSSRDV
nr:MAG TPA: hypothetical protein [Caudoviricetes sp.]